MNPELTCAIVRDLLPPYVEGLTAPETDEAVEAHLTRCPDCAARRMEMAAATLAPPETDRAVDYLKTVKRRSRRLAVVAALCAVAVLLGAMALHSYVLGVPANPHGLGWSAEISQTPGAEEGLYLSVLAQGLREYRDWSMETLAEGVVSLTAREVRPSALLSQPDYTTFIPLSGVTEIRLCDDVIWQGGYDPAEDGVLIYPEQLALYQGKTLYTGDASALGNLTERLGFFGLFGDYAHTLETAQPPYGWTITFKTPQDSQTDQLMRRFLAPQMLALVGNLEWVSWAYRDLEGNHQHQRMTLAEADGMLAQATADYNAAKGVRWDAKAGVKAYAATPGSVQMLSDICWEQMQVYYRER